MHVELHERYEQLPAAREAQELIRACVHCGFCTATCPTYLELGDERDGPRGRIHLLMQLLEGGLVSERTQRHLDRCLSCRSCETTCPSGVRYGRLADIGRGLLEERVPRLDPAEHEAYRWCGLEEALSILHWRSNKEALRELDAALRRGRTGN